ncbi:hypothetical protein [Litoribacillus peritrichatus]|uniref:Uncharacterized protein n=1 Tax=Litoribacillus peritrichatus TaxID=718191 RepID=A0ABP7NFE3_9GAMM
MKSDLTRLANQRRPQQTKSQVLKVMSWVLCGLFAPITFADSDEHYVIDDDHLTQSRWASSVSEASLPGSFAKFYETTLPNFFGSGDPDKDPSISISIQHMDETHPALSDDEKQQIIKPFEGDPLDRKAIVIEVPFN